MPADQEDSRGRVDVMVMRVVDRLVNNEIKDPALRLVYDHFREPAADLLREKIGNLGKWGT